MPPPDADLHPEATGLAKELVNKHSAPQPLKLYAGWFCPFVQRVWAVLEEKNIPYQYIKYDSKPLYESTVVCEFLEDAYPDHGLKLLPSDPYTRAQMRIWTDFVSTRIIPAFHRFLQFQPEQSSSTIDKVRSDFLKILRQFGEAMDEDGPFFLGKKPSLVDFALAPWAVRLWIFNHWKGGLGMPSPGKSSDERAWSKWRRWLAAIQDRKSIRETTSDKEHYIPIYERYADNTAQSELAKATREGKGVP